MSEAILLHFRPKPIDATHSLTKPINSSQWLLVCLFSFLFHLTLVVWFSSRTPDFPLLDSEQFKVSLTASSGAGETLQASQPQIISTATLSANESGTLLPTEEVNDSNAKQSLEVAEELMPITQELTENIELATEISPESTVVRDILPPTITDTKQVVENTIEESAPIKAEEGKLISANEPEIELVDTIGISAELANVDASDDFFKPAEVKTSDQIVTSLPIEQLSEVPAPEAIAADNNPELASDDVEILEIKARDVTVKRKPILSVAAVTKPVSTQQGSSNRQADSASGAQQTASKRVDKPLVIPKAYILDLKSWLNQFKQYPLQARRQKLQGVVIISLLISRDGQIKSYEIKRSSGHAVLDQEVEMMIKRAERMPALPETFPRETLELLIPIRFKVRSG